MNFDQLCGQDRDEADQALRDADTGELYISATFWASAIANAINLGDSTFGTKDWATQDPRDPRWAYMMMEFYNWMSENLERMSDEIARRKARDN